MRPYFFFFPLFLAGIQGYSQDSPSSPSSVTIILLGASPDAFGYARNGAGGGQRTMVWADNGLKVITNLHRIGSEINPPGSTASLAIDVGMNQGRSASDWLLNQPIYSGFISGSGTNLIAHYPQGGIYNPGGGTAIGNAYFVYFTPIPSNSPSTYGSFSYGRNKLTDLDDSTRHFYQYSPPPYTYIPDGMTISPQGKVFLTDIDQRWENGVAVYQGNIILYTGTWNDSLLDFEFTTSLLELPTFENQMPLITRIASDPINGYSLWIVTLADNGGVYPVGDVSKRYYPILFQSVDEGDTWDGPMAVQLDGPTGIDEVEHFLSDYRIEQIYSPPLPMREEIPYTTAFDCDLVVDKWGDPHIGVVIGVAGDNYTIITQDSTFVVMEIWTNDGGETLCGVVMGYLKTFRGNFGEFFEDNRVNATIDPAGEKVFITWLDTQVPGCTENNQPDLFARGHDLYTAKITSVYNVDQPDNVTANSPITHQAYFACASPHAFASGDTCFIPIVTEYLSDPVQPSQPVEFRYISNFYYIGSRFTIDVSPCYYPHSVEKHSINPFLVTVYPNPVSKNLILQVSLTETTDLSLEFQDLMGQSLIREEKGIQLAGAHTYTMNISGLAPGIYFIMIQTENQALTKKVLVH